MSTFSSAFTWTGVPEKTVAWLPSRIGCRSIIKTAAIGRLPRGPHEQPTGIEARCGPALLRNLDVGGVKVHTTGLCGVNRLGTRRHESKQERCSGDNCKRDFHRNSLFASHHRIYICFAALRARVHPERLPCASYRLARAIVAENCAFRRSFA